MDIIKTKEPNNATKDQKNYWPNRKFQKEQKYFSVLSYGLYSLKCKW